MGHRRKLLAGGYIIKTFKYQKTNKYSRLRNGLADLGLDPLQIKFVIQNVHAEMPNFGVGLYDFVCDDIFRYEAVSGKYAGQICDGYHVYAKN